MGTIKIVIFCTYDPYRLKSTYFYSNITNDNEKSSESESGVDEHKNKLNKSRIKAPKQRTLQNEDSETSESDDEGTSNWASEKQVLTHRKMSGSSKTNSNKTSTRDSSNDSDSSKNDVEKSSENDSDVDEHKRQLTKSRIKASSQITLRDDDNTAYEIHAGDSDSDSSDSEKLGFEPKKISQTGKNNRNKTSKSDTSKDRSRASSSTASSEDEMAVDYKNSKCIDSNIRDKQEKKQSRKSKENAMKEIYSESNRMLRESAVGLPYHRPRQRTLDDFLNRKKILPDVLPILGGIKLR